MERDDILALVSPPPRKFSQQKRLILLAAFGAVLLAALSALPAPKIIFRRSPTVADRIAGDVRRVVMAVEETGPYPGTLHAILEVWTDSDWDLEYWTSIPGIPDSTGKAKIITNDLIEQTSARLAILGDRLTLAWIERDKKGSRYTLKTSKKSTRDRDWPKPVTIAEATSAIAIVDLAVAATDGDPIVLFRMPGGRVLSAEGNALPRPDSRPAPTMPTSPFIPEKAQAAFAGGFYIYALSGKVSASSSGNYGIPNPRPEQDTLVTRGGCCVSIASAGNRTWFAWLQSVPGKGINRSVRLLYRGRSGPFTTATTIPVTALRGRV